MLPVINCDERKFTNEDRDWSCDLPRDILWLILLNIRLVNDIKKFGAVCKRWHLAAADYMKNHVCFGTQWLVKKKLMASSVTLYNPLADNPYQIDIPIPIMYGASVLCAKDGWLLMNKGRDVFFLSPFLKFIIKLPNLRHYGVTFTSFTITSAPTSKNWQICGLRQYQYQPSGRITKRKFGIFTLGHGDKDWTRTLCTVPRGYFEGHETNPVYHKGKFYFLCTNGSLGVLDPGTRSWKLLAFKEPERGGTPHLLECDGGLVSVFNWKADNVKVLKWDESRMIWNQVNNIEEYTFFLSEKTSYAKKNTRDYMKNKLFSTYLHGNYGVFYCLENGSYQTFGNELSCKNLATNTTLIFECCWMDPTQHDISSTTAGLETLSFDQCTSLIVADTDDDDDDSTEEEDDDINYRTEEEDDECLNIFNRMWNRM